MSLDADDVDRQLPSGPRPTQQDLHQRIHRSWGVGVDRHAYRRPDPTQDPRAVGGDHDLRLDGCTVKPHEPD